jgi:hypothetical protein
MTGRAAIGTATMRPDGTIILMLRAVADNGTVGDGYRVIGTDAPDYAEVLAHIGGLAPGQSARIPPWD